MDHLELTDQRDPRRPNLSQPFTEDKPPGTLEEVAPEDPKDPLPGDKVVEPGIPAEDPSPDTTEPPS